MVCEVPWHSRSIDAGGTKDGDLILIEAKTSFTIGLRQQLNGLPFYAHFALGVVGSKPRGDATEWCGKWGIGLWMVRGIEITELAPMRRQSAPTLSLMDRIQRMPEGVGGGRPNLKGIGPAQETQAEIDKYRATHPGATWKELFENIPNHYVSAKSMASAMKNNQERLSIRKYTSVKVIGSYKCGCSYGPISRMKRLRYCGTHGQDIQREYPLP
jgi:hypothetical protein